MCKPVMKATGAITVYYPAQKSEHRFNFLKPPIGGREGRRGDGHIGQGWVLRFKASNRSGHFCNPQGDVFFKNDSWKCWILAV
ncbi:hypothetical protein OUZ56_026239 [Daphnia magna]|uniref:Uncharacterized protein n=1 Tax=Daphnia magna TaxID=35525 RepID=A0ABQ9ZL60_9CRUS|nr:hypothetical protein OUZ56_026239 [Daphnia magna]